MRGDVTMTGKKSRVDWVEGWKACGRRLVWTGGGKGEGTLLAIIELLRLGRKAAGTV